MHNLNIEDIAAIYESVMGEYEKSTYKKMISKGYANAFEKEDIKKNPENFIKEIKLVFFDKKLINFCIEKLQKKYDDISTILKILKQIITLKTKKFMEIFLECDKKNKADYRDTEIDEIFNNLNNEETIETSNEEEKDLIKKSFSDVEEYSLIKHIKDFIENENENENENEKNRNKKLGKNTIKNKKRKKRAKEKKKQEKEQELNENILKNPEKLSDITKKDDVNSIENNKSQMFNYEEFENLKKEFEELEKQNKDLKTKNEFYKNENKSYENENKNIKKSIADLINENNELEKYGEQLIKKNDYLREENKIIKENSNIFVLYADNLNNGEEKEAENKANKNKIEKLEKRISELKKYVKLLETKNEDLFKQNSKSKNKTLKFKETI